MMALQRRAVLPVIRLGMPLVTGRLLELGLASGLPLLFSANAFSHVDAQKEFRGFNIRAAQALPADADCALDSSGFVAAVRFGDYRWSVDEYMELVAARAWSFWAPLDYCVEPQVAGDASVRKFRIDATVRGYYQCADAAARRNLSAPMPILQGWTAREYVECAQALALGSDTGLVGIGSVCRRHVHGPDGLLAITQALDAVLPAGVKLHYFGLKGAGLVSLCNAFPGRVGSCDSMAYDYGLRRACPVGRTQEMRAIAMVDWHARQVDALQRDARAVRGMFECAEEASILDVALKAVGAAIGDLHMDGELDYRDGKWLVAQDAAVVRALIAWRGAEAFAEEDPDDDFGLGMSYERVRRALVAVGALGEGMPTVGTPATRLEAVLEA